MSDIDVAFCRTLLKMVTKEVKKAFPNLNLYKDAWVYHFHRDSWEFHGPDGFYWHGSAANAYDTRAKGWAAYLKHKGVNVDGEDD